MGRRQAGRYEQRRFPVVTDQHSFEDGNIRRQTVVLPYLEFAVQQLAKDF
jgi:hypothetical protein